MQLVMGRSAFHAAMPHHRNQIRAAGQFNHTLSPLMVSNSHWPKYFGGFGEANADRAPCQASTITPDTATQVTAPCGKCMIARKTG